MAARFTKEGVQCPCCDQLAKVYRRRITPAMVGVMIELGRRHKAGARWVKIGRGGIQTPGGDYGWLVWWNMIECLPGEREDGSNRVGMWKLTDTGYAFLRDNLRVRRYVYVYAGKQIPDPPGADMSTVDIAQVLRRPFNFNEIVNT